MKQKKLQRILNENYNVKNVLFFLVMSFVTYILVAGLVMGTQDRYLLNNISLPQS